MRFNERYECTVHLIHLNLLSMIFTEIIAIKRYMLRVLDNDLHDNSIYEYAAMKIRFFTKKETLMLDMEV